MFKKIMLCLSATLSLLPALAQVQTGVYPYGSFDAPGFDSIDRGSLNVHFSIPVVTKQGRGLPFQYQLVYDGLVWTPLNSAGTATWTPATGWGLHGQLNEGFQGYLSYSETLPMHCGSPTGPLGYTLAHYRYHDPFGVAHPFTYTYNTCTGMRNGGGASWDGSGYSYSGAYVTSADGKQIAAPVNNQTSSGATTDTNGNTINNNGDGTFTDTLGKTALTITGSGTASSPRVFKYSTLTTTATVTVSYKTYQVQTVFGCASGEFNLSQDLVDKITLGDGSFYQFLYEGTPAHSPNVTGRLASLTLPQGGTITYAYTGANNGIICADGTPAGLNRAGGVTRTYVRSAVTAATSHTKVTDASSNVSDFDFVMAGTPEAFYETNRVVNQGASTNLLTRQTCYNASAHPCVTTAISLPIVRTDDFNSFNGSGFVGSGKTYNAYGLQTTQINYDFGSPGPNPRGGILRQETWTYPTSGIVNLVSSDVVTDGANTTGTTTYAYDETSGTGHAVLVTTSVPQHPAAGAQRGNLTTVTQSPGPGAFLITAAAYEDTGNPVSVKAPSGTSTYVYDGPTHTFTYTATPPTPSSGVSLASTATDDANSGVPLTAVDANLKQVTYAAYDPLLRPTEIDYPDGGKMIASYTATQTGVYHYMTASTHTNTQTNYDAYGRLNYVAVQNSSTPTYYWNNYCYDGNGNLQYAAYRFASGSLTCSGAGDTYTYDALGRVLTITHGDSSTTTYKYTGRATQVTDENGVSRITQVDGLGRPKTVCEISGTTLNGVAPGSCSLDITPGTGFTTTYAYTTDTANGNASKVVVTQAAQTRTFETDWLGRAVKVIEPESGTTTYSYAYSATAGLGLMVTRVRPQANQTGSTTTMTTTQYDAVGRVVSISYSDGTPNRQFNYDVASYWTPATTNLKGRLAVTGGGSGATWNGSLWSYDVMGRVTGLWQCGPATCGTGYQNSRPLSFAWDQAGNLTQQSDGASGTITYGRSIAGEVTSITNSTYTNLPYNPPSLASSVVNGPDGPVSYTLGNGLNVYHSYDTLGRLAGSWVCNGPAAVNCSGGTQIYGTTGQWKGSQMQYQSDTVLNQQVTYGYGDGFNRLTARTVTSGTVQNYTYAYDRYGNRWQTALSGGFNFNPTYSTTTNRITTSGYTYDAAGNMTSDSVHSYKYDAEGNILQVDAGSTATYVYDAFNHRVHVQTASATNEFIYDYAGRRVSTWLSPSNFGSEGRIYWDGQQFAYRSTDGTTYFDHQDTLGTERMRTNYGGTVGSSYQSLPWGDGYTATVNNSGADQDNAHFAGLDRDAESGTEHAQFRNYASAQGRWLAPDPYMGSYDLTNPQSMNRYEYALNNPTSFLDPSGLDYGWDCGDNCVGVTGTDDPNLCEYDPMLCYLPPGFPGGPGSGNEGGSAYTGPGVAGSLPLGPPRTATLSQHTGFDNPLANALFSPGVGGAYFGGASTAVNYAAAGTVGVYAAGFALPTALADAGFAEVAVGLNDDGGIHFAVGVDGNWMHAATQMFQRQLTMTSLGASDFAASAIRFSIPVLSPSAVLPAADTAVTSCLTGVCSAVLRGWIPNGNKLF